MKIAVVIVTFNRIKDLQITLNRYDTLTKKPDYIIIIDNASTDGTKDYLSSWIEINSSYVKMVHTCEENIGGAGGFSEGAKIASELDCDFVFFSDDDALPEVDVLEKLERFYVDHANENIAALCTSVQYNGKIQRLHRWRIERKFFKIIHYYPDEREYEKESFPVDVFTFVGSLIKTSVIKSIGFPRAEYFIYNDDYEYSLRVGEIGKIVCIPGARMNHGSDDFNHVNWKTYYGTRNELDLYKRHYSKANYCYLLLLIIAKKASIISIILYKEKKASRDLYKTALHDHIRDNYGKSEIYYPGKKVI